jgi:pimeloyl-ACP methyl ester carboxylesterase
MPTWPVTLPTGHHDEMPASPCDPRADVVPLTVTGAGGASISVRVQPGESAVPVVLVHGFGSNGKANWSATGWLRALARAGFTTVTVDVRGHGLSSTPHDVAAYTLPTVLTDLKNVLTALPSALGPVPEIDLIGYSMGGRLVGELVAAARDSPAHAGRMPWEAGLPAVRRAVIGGYDGRPLLDGVSGTDSAEFAAFRAALDGRAAPDGPGRRAALIATATRGNDLEALAALVAGLSTQATSLPPEAVEVPTLVAAGDRDDITDDTKWWASRLPRGEHLVLPGRDHISAITSALFRSAAVDFLAG